jgi:hypothetical protein
MLPAVKGSRRATCGSEPPPGPSGRAMRGQPTHKLLAIYGKYGLPASALSPPRGRRISALRKTAGAFTSPGTPVALGARA